LKSVGIVLIKENQTAWRKTYASAIT